MSIPRIKQNFDISFKTFLNDKTVICYVVPQNPLEFLNFKCEFEKGAKYEITSEAQSQYAFKGIATYKDGDTFDVEKAKQIAKKKAMRAYYKWVKRACGEVINKFLKAANERKDFVNQANEKIEKLTDEIKEMA